MWRNIALSLFIKKEKKKYDIIVPKTKPLIVKKEKSKLKQTSKFYRKNDFDLAGFWVGIIEKNDLITGQNIKSGDIVIGLKSSGFHSNGYSLIRHILKKKNIIYYLPLTYNSSFWSFNCYNSSLIHSYIDTSFSNLLAF